MTVYNKIGANYNSTRKPDPYIFNRLQALLQPEIGKRYIDVGCGTGNYTTFFAENGYSIIGVDPSKVMLDEAIARNPTAQWVAASAEQLPFEDNTFHGAIATFTVHHWEDMNRGFAEMARVLNDGSNMVLLTFTPGQESGYWLNHYFPKMMQNSIGRKNNFEAMLLAAQNNGFAVKTTEKYFVHPDLADLFCYAGKHNPELYFIPEVRSGISSFALWPEETDEGLLKLRQDINSGEFEIIRKNYENQNGDYIFVVLQLLK